MLLREETPICPRYSHKPSRNEKLFRYYLTLLKSYGDKATAFSKEFLYGECADVFDISDVTAGRIIRSIISEKKYVSFLSDLEYKDCIEVLLNYQKKV